MKKPIGIVLLLVTALNLLTSSCVTKSPITIQTSIPTTAKTISTSGYTTTNTTAVEPTITTQQSTTPPSQSTLITTIISSTSTTKPVQVVKVFMDPG
jgi:hypothetical protein